MINYISYILENNLTISRFMFDHSIILLALISYNDNEIRKLLEKEQQEYGQILLDTIAYSFNKITKNFINANILITDYTDLMESKTCKLFKIADNLEIFSSCQDLIVNSAYSTGIFTQEVYIEVNIINDNLLTKLNDSLTFLKQLHKKISEGMATMFFADNFIEHLIEEVEIYIYTLDFLKRQMTFTPTYVYKCKYYFNIFLKQHALYLKNMIFPIKIKFCDEAEIYINDFQKIADGFDDDISPKTMKNLNQRTKEITTKFIDYNTELIQNIIYNKYFASAIPLLNEHILRESNYINYQLDIFNSLS